MGGPELQLRVARCSKLDEIFIAAIVHLDARDGLRVAAIERFGETQNRRKRTYDLAFLGAERAEVRV